MLLVGPFLWANQNHPNRNYKGVNQQNARKANQHNARSAKQQYGQQQRKQKQYGANQGAGKNSSYEEQSRESKHAAGQGKNRPKHQTKSQQKSKAQIQAEQENLSVRQRSKVWVDSKTKEAKKAARPYVKQAKDAYNKAKYDTNKALNNSAAYQKLKSGLSVAGAATGAAASDLKSAWNNQEYVGPVEDHLYNWDQKAKNVYSKIKQKAQAYLEEKYNNGATNQNYYEYYQRAEEGVVKIAKGVKHSKAGKAWRRNGVIAGNDLKTLKERNHYIKTATFYNQQADEKLKLEANNPAVRLLSSETTREMINKHFDRQIKGWISAGHYNQISGNRQLAETLGQMYRGAVQAVLMGQLGLSKGEFQKVYKAEFQQIVENAIKAQQKELSRSAMQILTSYGRVIKNKATNSVNWVVRKIPGRSEKEIVQEAFGVNQQQQFGAINKSIPLRSLKLWPIETFYFNVAIAMSSYVHAAIDSTYNPLYRLDNAEQARHGFNPFGFLGVEVPFLEAMGLGFFGFILANQAFQKYAPYLKVPRIMRGYTGMGIGSIVSSAIEQVMMSPAHKMYWEAQKKYALAKWNGDEEQARKWSVLKASAKEVMMYDLTNSKFWKDQVEHVIALIGSSMAAMAIGVPYDKIVKNTAARRYQAVKNNPHLASKAAKAKNVVNGKVFTLAIGAKDIGRGALYLLGSHPVARVVHFTAFLFMDPIVRPMAGPMVKHWKAEDAYDSLNFIREELPQKRKALSDLVYLDRRVLDIYEGRESWYQRYFNAGDYQERAEIYWKFKDYYDAKTGYRSKQLEPLMMSHGRWKEFLQKFMLSSDIAGTMYGELEHKLLLAQEDHAAGFFPDGAIKPEVSNLLNFSTYSVLPKDTKKMVFDLMLSNVMSTERKYGFDESSFMLWQTYLYSEDMTDKGALIKHLKTDYSGNSHVIWMRNGTAEKILFNMVFGKDATRDNLFETVDGKFPEFHYPRMIRELPYGPKDIQFMQLDEKKAYSIGNSNDPRKDEGVTYFYPLTSIKFLDPDDSKYKNIFQLINDRALPEIKLGSQGTDNQFTAKLFLEKYALCQPEGLTNEEMAEAGSIDISKCTNDSIRKAYDRYVNLFARFIREKGANVLSRTSHQSEAKFSKAMLGTKKFFNYHPMLMLVDAMNDGVKNLDEVSSSHISSNQDQYKAFENADFTQLQTGNENPYVSLLEDIVAATGFLQSALPTVHDYDANTARSYRQRAQAIQDNNYGDYFKSSMQTLMINYLDSLLNKKAEGFVKQRKAYNDTVDQMEQTFNKAMCYLHDRPVELVTEPKKSGIVEIELPQDGGRFYRYYNAKKDTYTYTKIEKNAFCDFDQIQSQINLAADMPADAEVLDEDEESIDMSRWIRWFQADGKPALDPSEADIETLKKYFRISDNDYGTLADKILDAIMIEQREVWTKEDFKERENTKDALAELLQAHDEEQETAGNLGDSNYTEIESPDLRNVLAQAQGIELDKIKVMSTTKIVPTVSLRTAVASKAMDMLRKVMNEEAGQYQGFLLDLYDYSTNDFDNIATRLCDLRVRTANVYRASVNQPEAYQMPEASVCSTDYKDLEWTGDRDSEAWQNRQQENQELEDGFKSEDIKPGFWERTFDAYKRLFE